MKKDFSDIAILIPSLNPDGNLIEFIKRLSIYGFKSIVVVDDGSEWTTLFIFNLFSFGVIMLTLGIIGEYLWRTVDASRNRPPYIIEER